MKYYESGLVMPKPISACCNNVARLLSDDNQNWNFELLFLAWKLSFCSKTPMLFIRFAVSYGAFASRMRLDYVDMRHRWHPSRVHRANWQEMLTISLILHNIYCINIHSCLKKMWHLCLTGQIFHSLFCRRLYSPKWIIFLKFCANYLKY